MHIGSYSFRPRLLPSIAFVLVAAAMLALAFWQLRRADEKIALLAAAESAMSAPAVAIERLGESGEESLAAAASAYRKVRLTGCYDAVRQLLWDNRSHAGTPGFEAIIPLRLHSGRLALVNRGWLPLGPTRQDLPDLSLPQPAGRTAADVVADGDSTGQTGGRTGVGTRNTTGDDAGDDTGADTGRATAEARRSDRPEAGSDACVTIEGLFSRPSKGFMSGPAMTPPARWPRIIQYFDYPAIASAMGEPIIAGVVQLQQPDKPSARPEALVANWEPAASGPEKHYGYAFQWFAMATALTVLYFSLSLGKTAHADSDNDPEADD